MTYSKKRMTLAVVLLVAILAFIWGNSLLDAEHSAAFSDWVRSLLGGFLDREGDSESSGTGLLRKIAHFTEFAALGATLSWIFAMKGELGRHLWTGSLLCGLAAACIDETIQTFVPGRGPGLVDVWIDTCGVLLGIGILIFGHHFLRRHKQHKYLEDKT